MPAVLSPDFTEMKFHVIAHGLLRNLKSAVWSVWFSIPSPLDEGPPPMEMVGSWQNILCSPSTLPAAFLLTLKHVLFWSKREE